MMWPSAIALHVLLLGASPATRSAARLPGFDTSIYFSEQVESYLWEPQVKIHINAPAAASFDRGKPTQLIIYALPNGNTTAQTVGRQLAAGVDWHYGIQHIGAQTRRLREIMTDQNIVVAYVEAEGKSWPAWKTKHPDYRRLIPKIIDSIVGRLDAPHLTLHLTGHSGGGSFVFGFIDSVDRIPARVTRISFLDSNYGYSDELKHGDKLIEWLQCGTGVSPVNCHVLSVICYDDRNITLDGKPVVSPTGGTWRATQRMLDRLQKDVKLTGKPADAYARTIGLDGRLDIIMHPNPQNKILHTVLVGDMNGFIHAATVGTPYETKAALFNGPVTYRKWIQPGE